MAAFRVVLLLLATLAAPAIAAAQTVAVVARVATLGSEPTEVWDVFERRLKELGYVEGRNLHRERRWSQGFIERVPGLVGELLSTRPDVMVTSILPPGAPADAEHCTPILAIGVAEPYGACRIFPVANLSLAASARELGETHLLLAKAALPSAARMTVVTDPTRPFLVEYIAGLRRAAQARGVSLAVLEVSRESDVETLAAAIARQAPDALIVAPAFSQPHARRQVVNSAMRMRIPAIGSHVADGVVIAADYDWRELARRAATFVDQIVKGVKPTQLDREGPRKFDITVDRRAADVLGLVLPGSVLSQADRVLD